MFTTTAHKLAKQINKPANKLDLFKLTMIYLMKEFTERELLCRD